MSTPLFIWLGSGRARRRHVGPPASWLDRAAHAGLPVPPGAVLMDHFRRRCLEVGLATESGGRILIPDAELWHNTLFESVHLPHFQQPVNVFPVTADGQTAHPPVAREVDFSDARAAALAVTAAWSRLAGGRSDVLLIETVAAVVGGTATTTAGSDAPTDTVTTGDTTFPLPQLRGWHTPDRDQPAFARRLQQLLRGARRTLGRGTWHIDWADDGDICWLVLVRAGADERQPHLNATLPA